MNIPQKYIAIGILTIGVVGFLMAYQGAPAAQDASNEQVLSTVSVENFSRLISDSEVVLLDIRTSEEYSSGYIEGAKNLDFYAADFKTKLATLDRETSYAIYCRSGNRTGQALKIMRELGFTSVADLAGGVGAWQAAGTQLK